MKNNKTTKSSHTTKEPYITGLFNKPALELVEPGVPLNLEAFPDSSDDAPLLIDPEHFGKTYLVENDCVYTVRLGIRSNSFGIGTLSKDVAVACAIPTKSASVQHVTALFFIPEIHPVGYMDCIYLKSEKQEPFRLEYMLGSAMLESNNNSGGFILNNDAVHTEDDMLTIMQNGLEDEIPAFCSFAYDFISFRVKVVFE